jgi:2-polyprenyl-3-methyl-5-hydroxy-6-metoxy-1,4-benzoquinol methylase
MSLEDTIRTLPAPLQSEGHRQLMSGVSDSAETDVYTNEAGDFAFLHPRPEVDYVRYKPRVAKLGLAKYKKTTSVIERRFEKLRSCIEGAESVLEVGAGDASFLAHVRQQLPDVSLATQEIDQNTRAARDAIPGLVQYADLGDVERGPKRYDLVCFFHVLEHIFEPESFLADCSACLAPGGRLVIEVPSLDDPLLSVYGSEAYRRFYFQRQHPYVYSAASLGRLLEHLGFEVERAIHHQRYGLENHLAWLSRGQPGGSKELREIFGGCEADYMRALELSGRVDSFIAIAKPRS